MIKYLILILFFISKMSYSQQVTSWDYELEREFKIDLPDTLFVVWGQRIENGSYQYVDVEELYFGFDIFLLTEPVARDVYSNYLDEWCKRVDLNFSIEVFFGEDFRNDFDLRDSCQIYHTWSVKKFSKFKEVEILQFKKVTFLPYNFIGKRVSDSEFFDQKFAFERIVKKLFKKEEKKD